MSGGGGKSTTVSNTNSNTKTNSNTSSSGTTSPWGPAAGYFGDLYSTGKSALDAVQGKLFGGDFVAPATQGQRDSVASLYAAAPGLSTGHESLRDFALKVANGEFLDPNNPILGGAINAAINPLQERLQGEVMPGITDAAMRGGAYGGTSQALRETTAMDDWTENVMDLTGKMTLDWTNMRMADIFRSPELFKGANTLALAPGTVQGLAGEAERGLNQLENDDALKHYMNEIQAPWYGIQDFANLLTTGGFRDVTSKSKTKTTSQQSGQTTTTSDLPEADMATQFLQGGLGGLSALSSLGQAFPATMGAIGGGSVMAPILSGLSFLSDRKFKRDIVRVGEADNGLPIYRFKYIGSDAYQLGFMADEVETLIPDAVTKVGDISFVNYEKATERLDANT